MKKIVLSSNSSVLPLFALCLFVAIPVFSAPRIECKEPKYDFGTVIGQEKIIHEFIIRNRGDEPLVISKIKNCCGTESKVDPMTIPPGSNAVCTTVFTTKNRYGTQDKQILLVTNDKKHLYFDLRLTGTLLKPVEFSPRWIRLGDIMPDSIISENISATNLLDRMVTLESVSTTIKGLKAEIVKVRDHGSQLQDVADGDGNADQTSAPRRSWTIRLKSTGLLAVGRINGQVQLNFSSGTVAVPIIGDVKPVVQATPEHIRLSSSGSSSKAERLVMLRSGDGRAFDILSANLENVEGTAATKKLAEGKWQVQLTIKPDTIKADAFLHITTSLDAQGYITIPLSR